MPKLHIRPNSIQLLMERLEALAQRYAGGRFTILKDLAGWHVALDAPAPNASGSCEHIYEWGSGPTLTEAVNTLDYEIHREVCQADYCERCGYPHGERTL
jgi:hypothetical protein